MASRPILIVACLAQDATACTKTGHHKYKRGHASAGFFVRFKPLLTPPDLALYAVRRARVLLPHMERGRRTRGQDAQVLRVHEIFSE